MRSANWLKSWGRGLDHPLEILPDGTILCGHRRRAAAMLLGWETIDVVVRHDLAGQGEEAAERRLIEDNLDRRQMGPLAIARCYRALKTLGRRRGDRLCDSARLEVRDQIGKRLGVSGRTLDRHLRVLECTPPEVQHAVEAGLLPVTVAEKIAGLNKSQKEQIAKAIREGGKPAVVVRGFLRPANGTHKEPVNAVVAFLRGLERAVNDLEGRYAQLKIHLSAAEAQMLDRAEAMIVDVRAQARKTERDRRGAGRGTGRRDEEE